MQDLQPILIKYIKEIKAGNLDAFDYIYDLTKKQVYYSALSIIRNEDLVNEILQDTYIDFLNNIDKINEKQSITAYLCTIARNKALNMYKVKKREISIDNFENLDDFGKEEISYQGNEIFNSAKKILNQKEYEVVILHAVSDLTFNEISKMLKKPLGTVIWIYNNAIKKLKKGIGEEYETNR